MGDAYGAAIIEAMSKDELQMLSYDNKHLDDLSKNHLNDSTNDIKVLTT